MPLNILWQDITKIGAYTDLLLGGGVCGDIFHVAGPVYHLPPFVGM